jgi:hypothetical protein
MKKSFLKSLFKSNKKNCLGKKDKILKYNSKWPIYELDVFDKNGLWKKFENHLVNLEDKNQLKNIEINEIDDFYYLNSHIDFEINFFSSLMKKNYVFKYENQYYSYTLGYKSKNKVYVRFYFNIETFIIDESGD